MAMSQTMIWHGGVVLSLELARQMLAMTPADIQRDIAAGRLQAVRTPDGWRVPLREAFRVLGVARSCEQSIPELSEQAKRLLVSELAGVRAKSAENG